MWLKIQQIALLGLIIVISVSSLAVADENLFQLLQKKNKQFGDICVSVKEVIKEGLNPKEVTVAAIKMNYSVCLVVKCAIDAGASPEQVIIGALEAGATTEVVTRCAVEAGVEPETVAQVIEREKLPGLGYTPPAGPGPATIMVGIPGGGSGGGSISPSGF